MIRTIHLFIILTAVLAFGCESPTPETPKSSAKEISSPGIPVPNATSTFDAGSNTYTYTVPANTNIKAIAFNFSLPTGATAIPAPGSVQDFTNPIKYTITAEDGSKSVMTVVISFVKSSEKFFKFFDFNIGGIKYNGKIDEANSKVLVIVPKGTDLAKLSPVYGLSDRTMITPTESVSDFSKPKTYTLTAEDGSTRKYEVTVQIDNSIVNYAPEKYLGTFEKNLEGIRAKIEEILKVPIPKINRIYLWNRDGATTKNDTEVGELINDKTVNDLYSLKDPIKYDSGEFEKFSFQTKTDFTYPTKPVFSYAEPADSWFWTFSKKTLFIYNSTELITKIGGQNVISSFGVTLGRGKLNTNPDGTIRPSDDRFISIGWDGK